jgi:hypothetical protein
VAAPAAPVHYFYLILGVALMGVVVVLGVVAAPAAPVHYFYLILGVAVLALVAIA